MKKILFSILAMAAMAACATDEPIALNREAIQFGNAFVDNSVRGAVDPSYGTAKALDSIVVYGAVNNVNIYNGVAIKGTLGAAVWNFVGTVPTQYWIDGANYVFDAVVDATSVEQNSATLLPVSLHYTASTQKDMLHKRVTCTGKINATGVVPFTFTHLLSKVKFTVENTTASTATGYQYTITDITLTNAYKEGDYAVPSVAAVTANPDAVGTWTSLVPDGTHTIADMTVASATTAECAQEVLLIPGAKVGITFNVIVQMKKGTNWVDIVTYEKKYLPADVNVTLEANKAYNFKVTLGLDEPIQFTATEMNAWENGNTHDSNDADDVKDNVPVPTPTPSN